MTGQEIIVKINELGLTGLNFRFYLENLLGEEDSEISIEIESFGKVDDEYMTMNWWEGFVMNFVDHNVLIRITGDEDKERFCDDFTEVFKRRVITTKEVYETKEERGNKGDEYWE